MGRDGAAGLVCLGGSLLLLWATLHLPQSPLVPIGPAFYPRILLGITAGLSALLVVSDLLRRRGPVARGGRYRHVILAFLIFGGYVFALSPLGYRVATFLFAFLLQVALDPPESRQAWLLVLAVALGTAAVTYYAFEIYLFVLLPRGWITGF
ncbi:MAG: tripartite tricarboxylate transporter TctB family protein [Nitrospinota bacterium]